MTKASLESIAMLPRVILHNAVSVDGRIDWFSPDVGLYYELAARWKADAVLAGADTIFNPQEDLPAEDETALEPPQKVPNDTRPLLVVPDSRGRVRNWHVLRTWPYWRGMVALTSKRTPREYLSYLQERHVEAIVAGHDHVDMRTALEALNACYGVKIVRVDSGGTLNGVLLRAGLVNEVSALVEPYLVGGTTPRSLFRAPDLTSAEGVIELRLISVETLQDYLHAASASETEGIVWLRYEVLTGNRRDTRLPSSHEE
jgi:2,5-diamino-6-(ribosylamino)-4(3H)-pyrimidinone 5'-phosphate reductase